MSEQTKADVLKSIYVELQDMPVETVQDILDYVRDLKAKLASAQRQDTLQGEMVGHERREYNRLDTTVPIAYKLANTTQSPTKRKVLSRDISGGGTRLVLFFKDRVDLGDELEMEIFLPLSPSPITTTARVVRVLNVGDLGRPGFEVGVEFSEIPEKRRIEIERFVQSHLEE